MNLEALIKEIKEKLLPLAQSNKTGLQATAEAVEQLKTAVAELTAKLEKADSELHKTKLSVFGTVSLTPFEGNEEAAVKFLKWFRDTLDPNTSIKVADAQNETTAADGGDLVPDEFRAVLIRLVGNYGKLRKGATIVPMKSKTLDVPKLVSGVTVYWIGENSALTKAKAQFSRITLEAKKLCALVPLTNELIEDSAIDIANLIVNLIAESFAKEEDRVGFVGDSSGTDPFDGILYKTGHQAVIMATTLFADITFDDIIDMITAIPDEAEDGATFHFHKTILGIMRKIKDNEDNYIFQAPAGANPGTIFGYPYTTERSLPKITDTAADTPFVCFGNLKYVMLGDRMAPTVKTSEDAVFDEDVTLLRVIERIAIEVAVPEAFSVLYTKA